MALDSDITSAFDTSFSQRHFPLSLSLSLSVFLTHYF